MPHRRVLAVALTVLMGCASPRATLERRTPVDCAQQLRLSRAGTHGIDRACLRLGSVALGMSRAEVEEKLGRADFELRAPATCTNAVYVLGREITAPTAETPTRLWVTTLRLVYRDDHVAVVEVQGKVAREDFSFGPVRLGDTAEAVRRAFGQAHVVSPQVWTYRSVLFLLDDDGVVVQGMAVTETEDAFACLLPATLQLSCDSITGQFRGATVVRPPNDEIRLHGAQDWPGAIVLSPRACHRLRAGQPPPS